MHCDFTKLSAMNDKHRGNSPKNQLSLAIPRTSPIIMPMSASGMWAFGTAIYTISATYIP